MTSTVTATEPSDADAGPQRSDPATTVASAASAWVIRARLAEEAARQALQASGFPTQRLDLIDQAITRWVRRRRRLNAMSTAVAVGVTAAALVLTLIGVHPFLAFGAIYPLAAVRWCWTRSVHRHYALERVTLNVRRALCYSTDLAAGRPDKIYVNNVFTALECAADIVERDFVAVTAPFVRLRPDSGLHEKAAGLAAHLRELATRSLDESVTDDLVRLIEVLPYWWAGRPYPTPATTAGPRTPRWRIAAALLAITAPTAAAIPLPAWSSLFALTGVIVATATLSGLDGLRDLAAHRATPTSDNQPHRARRQGRRHG